MILNYVDASKTGDFEEVMRIADRAGVPVRGAIATSFGCPFEGNVPVEQVGRIAERFQALGMQGVGLGDTTGMATPPLVVERCRHLAAHQPNLPVLVKGDKDVPYGDVVVVMSLLQKAGAPSVGLMTDAPET